MNSGDPTWWQTLLDVSSPLWNLLSALLGGLIAALTAWRLERSRTHRDAERERRAHARQVYRDAFRVLEESRVHFGHRSPRRDDPGLAEREKFDHIEMIDRARAAAMELTLFGSPAVAHSGLDLVEKMTDLLGALLQGDDEGYEKARHQAIDGMVDTMNAAREDLGLPLLD